MTHHISLHNMKKRALNTGSRLIVIFVCVFEASALLVFILGLIWRWRLRQKEALKGHGAVEEVELEGRKS